MQHTQTKTAFPGGDTRVVFDMEARLGKFFNDKEPPLYTGCMT